MKKIKIGAIIFVFTALVALTAIMPFQAFAVTVDPARAFSAKYDRMFENFDRTDFTDLTLTGGASVAPTHPYLHASFEDGTTDSPDHALYKEGQPDNDAARGNLVIIMRSPDGSAALSELMLGIRRSDTAGVYSKAFTGLRDGTGASLPALTSNFQKYIISFSNSYEDTEVFPGNGEKVNEGMAQGIHIFNNTGDAGILDIERLYWTTDALDNSAAARNILNDFIGGGTVTETMNSAWWAGSGTGYIVKPELNFSGAGTAEIVHADTASGNYGYIVIGASGDTDNLKVAFWNGTAFTAEADYSRALELPFATTGVKFTLSSGDAAVTSIFFTNFKVGVPATGYPIIDPAHTMLFESFNVPQSVFSDVYEDMAARPEPAAAGVWYRLSYAHPEKISINGGALTLTGEGLAADATPFVNFKTETKTPAEGYQYIVLKMKGAGGANLDTFRFGLGGSEVWGNGGLLSGVDFPIPALDAADYPYTAPDGWIYYVVDLDESGFTEPENGYAIFNAYYGGPGSITIDEIFFADKLTSYVLDSRPIVFADFEGDTLGEGFWWTDIKDATLDGGAAKLSLTAGEYSLFGGAAPANNKDAGYGYMVLRMKADGTVGLDNFRIVDAAAGSEAVYFHDFVSYEGKRNFPALTTDYRDFIIDLEGSGLNPNTEGFRIFVGGGDSEEGNLWIDSIKFVQRGLKLESVITDTEGVFTNSGTDYFYVNGYDAPAVPGYNVLALEMKGSQGANLDSVRLEFKRGETSLITLWAAENAAGRLTTPDRKPLGPLTTDFRNFYIDLTALGDVDYTQIDNFHIHSDGLGGTLTVASVKYGRLLETNASIMSQLPIYPTPDITKPVLGVTVPATAKRGGKITIGATATDDVTANPNVTYKVEFEGKPVTLMGNSFTAKKPGVYTVTVTATDEAGNITTVIKQVTVSAGLAGGEIAAIVVASVVALGAIICLIWYCMKRKKKISVRSSEIKPEEEIKPPEINDENK
jgi:PKD domain.